MNKLATVLLCANFITVLFPQPGYIHPDEFFQSSEIVAGDVLDVQHFRVWEFNGTSAVRNIVFPYLVMAPSLYLLQWINSTGISAFQLSAVKVVMATRLPIAFLSLLGYVATGRLAEAFNVDKHLSTVLYCSSYITWTYYTRTFSNSIESVLLAVVLLLALTFSGEAAAYPQTPEDSTLKTQSTKDVELESRKENKETLDSGIEPETQKDSAKKQTTTPPKSRQFLNKSKRESTENIDQENDSEADVTGKEVLDDKKKTERANKSEESDNEPEGENTTTKEEEQIKTKNAELSVLRTYIIKLVSFLHGVVVTAGFFNRPTFLVFAVVPVLYWIWNSTRNDHHGRWRGASLISVVFSLSLGALLTFIVFVILDTLYFNPEFITVASKSAQYFIDNGFSLNTLQTGLQALASVIVVTPWNFLQYNSNVSNLAQHGLHPCFTHFLVNLPLLLGPLFLPIIIFLIMSIFQLYRKNGMTKESDLAWLFFMSLIPVLCLSVFPHQEPRFLIPALPLFVVMGAKVVSGMMPGKLSFFGMWVTFNILLTLIYGYMHQAALIPALSIYQQKLSSSSHLSKNYHLIFYKTYPPPCHLLLQPPNSSKVSIHELAGAPLETLVQTIDQVQSTCQKSEAKCQTYILLPSTVTPEVIGQIPDKKVSMTSICPHLSMEAPPRLWAWWKKRISFDEMIMDFCLNILTLV